MFNIFPKNKEEKYLRAMAALSFSISENYKDYLRSILKNQFAKTKEEIHSQKPGVHALKEFFHLADKDQAVTKFISDADIPTIIPYAKELGFNFSEEDINTLAKVAREQTEELSDQDLELVSAAGVNWLSFLKRFSD